jgi:hypothetical protein
MKIFGIGWAKTGTTTLKTCFQTLGYSHKGYDLNLVGNPEQALVIARLYDTFQDWPWTLYYKELDEAFPGSKFILTTRDSGRWLRSYRNAISKQQPTEFMNEARKKIYGFLPTEATDQQLIERYERHNADVHHYFADRPQDLLVVNWEKGDGWEELRGLLGKPIPKRPFPHSNKGVYEP